MVICQGLPELRHRREPDVDTGKEGRVKGEGPPLALLGQVVAESCHSAPSDSGTATGAAAGSATGAANSVSGRRGCGVRSPSLSESPSLSTDPVPIRPFDSDSESDTDSEPACAAFHRSTVMLLSLEARPHLASGIWHPASGWISGQAPSLKPAIRSLPTGCPFFESPR